MSPSLNNGMQFRLINYYKNISYINIILLFHIVSFHYFSENCLFLIRTGNKKVACSEIFGKTSIILCLEKIWQFAVQL